MATDLSGGVKGLRRALALALLLAAALSACVRGSPAETGEEARVGTPLLSENRLELPEFDLPKFQALLRELRGTPVVVNIWGSWCAPCRVEAPDLAEVSREFEGRVQFVGVDISMIEKRHGSSSWSSTGPIPACSTPREKSGTGSATSDSR